MTNSNSKYKFNDVNTLYPVNNSSNIYLLLITLCNDRTNTF